MTLAKKGYIIKENDEYLTSVVAYTVEQHKTILCVMEDFISAELASIIKEMGLISVTPGIRFADDSANDQKRIATPAFAKENGSTYIVVGRSITGAADPVAAYKKCVKEFC